MFPMYVCVAVASRLSGMILTFCNTIPHQCRSSFHSYGLRALSSRTVSSRHDLQLLRFLDQHRVQGTCEGTTVPLPDQADKQSRRTFVRRVS